MDMPAVEVFRAQIGRTGLSRLTKKHDGLIDEILHALGDYEPYRGKRSDKAIMRLRRIRKACVQWLQANEGASRASAPSIKRLMAQAHDRVLQLVVHLYPKRAAVAHADVRPKTVYGLDAVGKHLDSHYALERDLPDHLPMGDVDKMTGAYRGSRLDAVLDFETFIAQVYMPMAVDDPSARYLSNNLLFRPQADIAEKHLDGGGVAYLDAEQRKAYEIKFKGGLIWTGDRDHPSSNDEPFHTGDKRTEFMGAGWAIYVLAPDNRLYAGNHEVNKFHHSSFLSGEFAQAAGELAVDRGRLVAITPKTGHYKSGSNEFLRMLFVVHSRLGGAKSGPLASVKACPEAHIKPHVWYSAAEVLENGGLPGRSPVTAPDSPPVQP